MITYNIGEHYYTASKFKNGFDTLDYSKFLSTDEVRLISQLALYKAADGLSNSPSQEEINEKFPVNIAFIRLPTVPNRFVYLHSNYTGKANHTPDRDGNYFSHSVILKDKDPLCPAVYLFDKFSFQTKLTIEQDELYQTKLNESTLDIDDDDLRVCNQYFLKYCNELIEDASIQLFAKLLDLIVDGKLAVRTNRITICGEHKKIQKVILALNFFLPQHLANKISFATYVNDPTGTPFQITGIIPECGITSLSDSSHSLIDATSKVQHEPKNDYTKFILEIIGLKSTIALDEWRKYNKSTLNEFFVSEPDIRLNSPIRFYNFIKDPLSKNILDFKELINSNLPLEKEQELKRITAEINQDLYLNFVIEELRKISGNSFTFIEKKHVFQQIYLEHLENNNSFRQNCLPQILDIFREISGSDKSEACLFILLTAKCTDVHPPSWLNEVFQLADEYFAPEYMTIEDKLEPVRTLNEKYNLKIYQESIPNIMKVKSFDDIRKAAEKDDFVRNIRNYKDFLNKASDKEKLELLLLGFNHDAYFFKTKFQNFDNYIKVVKDYLPAHQPEFWFRFFENNRNFNKESNPKKHSIDYLKKKFVSLIFINQIENHDLFSKINLEDSYTIRWIEEEIREKTTREAVLQTFAEAFKDYSAIKQSPFWNFFKK
jgi:hypothetical protein